MPAKRSQTSSYPFQLRSGGGGAALLSARSGIHLEGLGEEVSVCFPAFQDTHFIQIIYIYNAFLLKDRTSLVQFPPSHVPKAFRVEMSRRNPMTCHDAWTICISSRMFACVQSKESDKEGK